MRRTPPLATSLIVVASAAAVASGAAPLASQSQADSAHAPGSTLIPLPVLFYQPETGTGFGALATYAFYPGQSPTGGNARVQPSTVTAIGIYTTKKQIVTALEAELFLSGGRTRVFASAGYVKFPTKFWGIGNETADEAEEDFTPESVEIQAEVQREITHGWYVGVSARVAHRRLVEVADGGLLQGGSVPGSTDGRVTGGGVLLTRDTRDNTVYPQSGSWMHLQGSIYDGALGSEFEYRAATLDLRQYLTAFVSHVVALRAVAMASSEGTPFDLLPTLGGDALLRGYYDGRFRDRHLTALQAEYRAPLWWRIGAVAFVEAGQVAGSFGDFRWGGFKTSLGGGIRIRLSDEGLNIRADYGYGLAVEEGGFYLAIGEAF
jgi:hypothetical protein